MTSQRTESVFNRRSSCRQPCSRTSESYNISIYIIKEYMYIHMFMYTCWTLHKHWLTMEIVKVKNTFLSQERIDDFPTVNLGFGNPLIYVYI